MRFVAWLADETCGKAAAYEEGDGEYACLRIKGHEGDCQPVAMAAAKLDGVRFCCRVAIGQPHHDRCPLLGDA